MFIEIGGIPESYAGTAPAAAGAGEAEVLGRAAGEAVIAGPHAVHVHLLIQVHERHVMIRNS
ncbi:hypothetical protein SUDANB58_03192 [Streptomyces sp. enrichment culture]